MMRAREDDQSARANADKWQGPSLTQLAQAAALCAIDRETDEQIAARLGVCRRTLARWKKRPEFAVAMIAVGEYAEAEMMRAVLRRHLRSL